MFNSGILDVVIGLIFIYLFLSLICSIITEWVSRFFKLRAKNLEEGIRNLLNDPNEGGLTLSLYNHPLIKGLTRIGQKPSYIPSRTFALALMDMIAPSDPAKGSKTIEDLREGIKKIPSEGLRKTIFSLLEDAENNLKKARENIERWFDEAMDRASGWYKTKSQGIVFICALVVTILFNADTISITKTLYSDPTMRAGLVAAAQEIAKQPIDTNSDLHEKLTGINEEIKKIQFPIGWTESPSELFNNFKGFFTKASGWLITSLALSLGAPFWFDMVNKFINIRLSGIKPEKTKKDLKAKESEPR